MGPSEKYAVCRGSVSEGMRLITACCARPLQSCTSRIGVHFLPTFQEVTSISKTRNQLYGKIRASRKRELPKVGWYAIGTSTTLESNKSPGILHSSLPTPMSRGAEGRACAPLCSFSRLEEGRPSRQTHNPFHGKLRPREPLEPSRESNLFVTLSRPFA